VIIGLIKFKKNIFKVKTDQTTYIARMKEEESQGHSQQVTM